MKRIGEAVYLAMITVGVLCVVFAPQAAALPASVLATTPKQAVCQGLDLTGGNTCGDNGAQFNGAIAAVINLLSVAVGVAAVIMIVVAGFRFITSGGDAGKVSGAKNTIVYALIGLVLVMLAQGIVHFVLNSVK